MLFQGSGTHRLRRLAVTYIRDDAAHRPSQVSQLLLRTPQRIGVAPDQHEVRPRLSQCLRDGATQAATTARHERLASVQAKRI
jgi:hypothetical protein